MHSKRKFQGAILLVLLLVCGVGAFASDTDDYIPEVTDRVARISFIRGDVQIRRADNTDWERAVLNLPIVEGDEIVTDSTSRLEIQLNVYTHLRIAESTQVRMVGLKDEGIAISVPIGSVSLRAVNFDPAASYFEIDAPRTTVSVQKSGSYRVDAGANDSTEIFVATTEGGEARVYSSDAGFTVRDGRRARIFIGGNQIGEWEMADASRFIDEFDQWGLDRDEVIAAHLRDSYYDRYYDRDIYAADDLNDYGDWVHTQIYGYVWRPYRTSISSYRDWSPYRYGHWRWIPSYGWTWVNDEPWGWATYHHGRWVWYNGSWFWSPYSHDRGSRSWWRPALVVVSVVSSNVCWYPLPWGYGYYDYNYSYYSHYYRRRGRNNGNNNQGGGSPSGGNPTPPPAPGSLPITPLATNPRDRNGQPPLGTLPPGSVVTIPVSEFGRGKGKFATAPLETARTILSKTPDAADTAPILPTYGDLNGKVSSEIRSVRAPMIKTGPAEVQTGAAVRKTAAPLDQELKKTRILGNRQPLQINTSQGEVKLPTDASEPVRPPSRNTGAVERPVVKPVENTEPIREAPPVKQQPPVYAPPTRQVEPVRSPRYEPPPTKAVEPNNEPVRVPRYDPPPKNDPPPVKNDPPPRNDPPPKSAPPPSKSDPPPSKSEPSKPDGPIDRKRDGRS